MFGLPGGTEWIMLLLIVLLLFGSARLPRLAKSIREAKDEFQKGKNEEKDEKPASEAEVKSEAKTEEST